MNLASRRHGEMAEDMIAPLQSNREVSLCLCFDL